MIWLVRVRSIEANVPANNIRTVQDCLGNLGLTGVSPTAHASPWRTFDRASLSPFPNSFACSAPQDRALLFNDVRHDLHDKDRYQI